jgi:iron(III) transport system substrate-binding protein
MKKIGIVFAATLVVTSFVFAAGSRENQGSAGAASSGPSGRLVVYTTTYDAEYELIVGGFEKKYPNIRVEPITAGAGELKTRIKAEAANPQGDVMFGGLLYSDAVNMPDSWESYVSPNNASMPENFRNSTGKLSFMTLQIVNLLVNKEEAAKLGVTITSYDDLLNPKLKGKIINANPTSSSSAWNQLTTILAVKGGYDNGSAWDYIEKLVQNLGGVMTGSSSTVYKGVFNGEYVVGLTYEAPCITYIEEGYGNVVEIVYPSEGITAIPFASAIIRNAKNMDNAKLFIDWVTSDEAQKLWAGSTARQANTNLPTTNTVLVPVNKIKILPRDENYLAENEQKIKDRWNQLWAKYN